MNDVFPTDQWKENFVMNETFPESALGQFKSISKLFGTWSIKPFCLTFACKLESMLLFYKKTNPPYLLTILSWKPQTVEALNCNSLVINSSTVHFKKTLQKT